MTDRVRHSTSDSPRHFTRYSIAALHAAASHGSARDPTIVPNQWGGQSHPRLQPWTTRPLTITTNQLRHHTAHTSAPGGPQARTITTNQSGAPTAHIPAPGGPSGSSATSQLEVHVPQSPRGGSPLNAVPGGDPSLLLLLQLSASHVQKTSAPKQAVVWPFATPYQTEREKEQSHESTKQLHKHTINSILQGILL